MSDQGRWFKLWTTAPDDPDLGNLSLEDFGRWCLLGVYLKVHGHDGVVMLTTPATAFSRALHLPDFDSALTFVRRLPNCSLVETDATVTYRLEWNNWQKYQGDYSGDRVRKFRNGLSNRVTHKRRGEEKRGEEKKEPPTVPPFEDPPPNILKALDQARLLGAVPRLRSMVFWRATIRATNNGQVDYAREILRAEAWLVSNPTRAPRKDLARFLSNWLGRAGDRT